MKAVFSLSHCVLNPSVEFQAITNISDHWEWGKHCLGCLLKLCWLLFLASHSSTLPSSCLNFCSIPAVQNPLDAFSGSGSYQNATLLLWLSLHTCSLAFVFLLWGSCTHSLSSWPFLVSHFPQITLPINIPFFFFQKRPKLLFRNNLTGFLCEAPLCFQPLIQVAC